MAKKWENCKREDLKFIPYAIERGWQPKFSSTDNRYGRNTPDNAPMDTVSFSKGNKIAWRIIKRNLEIYSWKVADIVNKQYSNQREYEWLKELLDNE